MPIPSKGGYKKGQPSISQKIRDRQAKAVGLEWLEPCGKGKDKTAIRCLDCGHEWASRPSNIASGERAVKLGNLRRKWGCPECARKARYRSYTGSKEKRDAEALAVGAEWLGPPVNQFVKVPIRCLTCKHEWEATAVNIRDPRRTGVACRKCKGPARFDASQPAMVYLATKKTAVKIGVTGDIERESRLHKFRRQGWDIVGTWHFPCGRDALDAEGSIIEWWRKELKAPQSKIKMYGNGEKETASLSRVPLQETADRIAEAQRSKFGHGTDQMWAEGCLCPACLSQAA